MTIVFLSGGARERALRYLLERDERIVAVVTPRLSPKNRRFERVVRTAVEFGVPVFPVTRDTGEDTLRRIDYEVLVSCGFPYLLGRDAIQRAKYAINVHPTLLPKYRGFRSGPFVILNGEKQSGVTIHLLTEEADKGDVLAQEAFDLSPFDTTRSVYRKCREIEPPLLHAVIQQIKAGTITGTPQDEALATTYTAIRTPGDSLVDWNKPLRELYHEIRACDAADYPAYFFVEGEKVCIKLWRPEKPAGEEDMI